jgi:hypothetical protein
MDFMQHIMIMDIIQYTLVMNLEGE